MQKAKPGNTKCKMGETLVILHLHFPGNGNKDLAPGIEIVRMISTGGQAMLYSVLADVVVAVHFAYVSYVAVGLLVILYGVAMRRQWVRNPWFRWSHLLMICIVAGESLASFECPLTTWEYSLRKMAGQRIDSNEPGEGAAEPNFVGRLLHNLMFFDDLSSTDNVFTIAYVSFALVVVATFVVCPPRRFRRKSDQAESTPGLVKV